MKILILCFIALFGLYQDLYAEKEMPLKKIKTFKNLVTETFKIDLEPYSGAFNPSICEISEGYVLTFRYLPEPIEKPWISYVGIALFDRCFQLLSKPSLLNLRQDETSTPSQAEDARIFSHQGSLYIIYNDNRFVENTTAQDRRDMFIVKICYENGYFSTSTPIRLIHSKNHTTHLWEKNWTPFVFKETLLLYYSINPGEILDMDWKDGACFPLHASSPLFSWQWGSPRGGTPAELIDNEYLAFFHSSKQMASEVSNGKTLWHYFMGAYTFSKDPPFKITKISSFPINAADFYTYSEEPKRVIYPGGYVIAENTIYLAYGKDDHEVWIAAINKSTLMKTLEKVRQKRRGKAVFEGCLL